MIKGFRRRRTAAAACSAGVVSAVGAVGAALALALGGAAWPAAAASASTFPFGQCLSGNLAVWVNPANPASAGGPAGTTDYHLEYTNVSNVTCFLWGYPGVLATTLDGTQLGSAAAHDDPATGKNVYLAPGATAHSVLGYVRGDVTAACKPAAASFLKVDPPGSFGADRAFFALPVCTTRTPVDLTVWRFRAGL